MPRRRESGRLEAEVLSILWGASQPLAPAEVRDAVAGDLAYTTVMTILGRLYDKGAVRRERRGRAYAYTAVLDEPGLAAAKMWASVDGHRDREAVLARFVDGLSDDDERLLRSVLASGADELRESRPH
ncbi:MAG: BlaI/MecI/CopY family transcriptional regulator [Mycobacteriales bacterium]